MMSGQQILVFINVWIVFNFNYLQAQNGVRSARNVLKKKLQFDLLKKEGKRREEDQKLKYMYVSQN